MTAFDKIIVSGLAKAEEFSLNSLTEKIQISFNEDITENFINGMIEDLNEFQTLEQFPNTKNLFLKAAIYTYGKGTNFALSYRINKPIDKIGYNFDDCMTANFSEKIPEVVSLQIARYKKKIIDIYNEMYSTVKENQEVLIQEGKTFNDCLFRILSGVFFLGKKVGLSIDIDENTYIDFSSNKIDIKYDYDTYDEKYKDSNVTS